MPLATTRANASVLGLRGTLPPVQWVMVHELGNLATSNDRYPAVWTSRTSSFGSSDIRCVASNGTGTWVAVGDAGKIASSTDGITWTQRTSNFGTTNIRWVAYGGGTWVAVGDSGKISTSTDATTWTAVTTATSGWSTSYGIYHVAYGNGNWVGNNTNGTLKQTTDPTGAWTTRTEPFGTGQHYAEYHPSLSIWTAGVETGTDSGDFASSTDAQTWTSRTPATSSTADTPIAFASNSSFILSSSNSGSTWVMQKSTNGTTWSAVTEPSTQGILADAPFAVRGYDEDIIVGYRADILGTTYGIWSWTTDGSTFTSMSGSAISLPTCIAHRLGHQSIR